GSGVGGVRAIRFRRGPALVPRGRGRASRERRGAGGALLGGRREVQGERRCRRACRNASPVPDAVHGYELGDQGIRVGEIKVTGYPPPFMRASETIVSRR